MVRGTKQLRKLRRKVIDAPQLFHFIITSCVGTDKMTNIICMLKLTNQVVSNVNFKSVYLLKINFANILEHAMFCFYAYRWLQSYDTHEDTKLILIKQFHKST